MRPARPGIADRSDRRRWALIGGAATMDDAQVFDALFREAVSAIGAGDMATLERLLAAYPSLARNRLTAPGSWLRDKIGGALDGFFKDPYLLWFVSEDVPVHGRLPKNIAEVTRAILRSARGAPGLQEQ